MSVPSLVYLFAANLPTLVLVLVLVIYINKSMAKVKDDINERITGELRVINDKFAELKAEVAALAARMDVLEKIILSQHPAAKTTALDLTEPTPQYNQK